MVQAPTYDLSAYTYSGMVLHPFHCPVYDAPPPHGSYIVMTLFAMDCVGPFLEFRASEDGQFVSAKIDIGLMGWVNVWRRGTYYMRVMGEPRPAAAG